MPHVMPKSNFEAVTHLKSSMTIGVQFTNTEKYTEEIQKIIKLHNFSPKTNVLNKYNKIGLYKDYNHLKPMFISDSRELQL